MLGLVSYEGSSDEDSTDSSTETLVQPKSVNSSQLKFEQTRNIADEEDFIANGSDIILKVSNSQFHLPMPISHNLKPLINNSKVKISIPSLDEFDEEEEEKPRKIKLSASTKGCGLFSMLPKPRNEFLATPRQLPSLQSPLHSSKTLPNSKSSVSKASTSISSSSNSKVVIDDEDDVIEDDDNDFFTIPDKTNIDDMVPEKSLEEYMKPLVPKKQEEPKEAPVIKVPESPVETEAGSISVNQGTEDIELNNDVLRKLGARKRKGEELIVREVDGRALMPDAQEWLTKTLSEETTYRPSAKKHEGPTSQQKRKHQITYLAFQAKANELNLKNQWANNRQSKRQTQSKYGF